MPDHLDSMLDFLYDGARADGTFRELYKPPPTFEHGKWYHVATVAKDEGSDGQTVEIDECRLPARFYRIRVLDGVNSVGEPKQGFTLSAGSDMADLTLRIARAVAEGMLGLAKEEA